MPNPPQTPPGKHSGKHSASGPLPRRKVLAPLTEALIRSSEPRRTKYQLWDGRGLFLWVWPSGSKLWRLQYHLNGRRNIISLGIYPDVSLAKARERRDAMRRQVADGVDPSKHRQEARDAIRQAQQTTVRQVSAEWLAKRTLAPRTERRLSYLIEDYVNPALGSRPVAQLTAAEILAMLRPIEAAGRLETAHRTKQLIGRICRYAAATGRATSDPTTALSGALAQPVTTHLAAITKPKEIGALLRAIESYQGTASVRQALRIAPYLFVRPGELRHMEWGEIDWKGELWRIPARKMKMRQDHLVPLSKPALAILREMQPWAGDSVFCFPQMANPKRPISDNSLNAALARLGYGHDEMTPHGFRSMASTRLHEMGWPSDQIEIQLAHRTRGVKGIYNRAQWMKERTAMMAAWARELDRLRTQKA